MTFRTLAVGIVALSLTACTQSDRADTQNSVNAAATAAVDAEHAVATAAARTIAAAPSAATDARRLAHTAAADVRAGAQSAETSIDDALRTAAPPTKNFVRATAVKAKLIAIDVTSGSSTNVVVSDDLAQLTGAVTSAAIVLKFEAAAVTVPGIHHVSSHLTVNAKLPSPAQPAKDIALDAVVRANLAVAGGLPTAKLGVDSRDGAVHLSGEVSSAPDRDRFEAAVRHTAGVTSVDDTLAVK